MVKKKREGDHQPAKLKPGRTPVSREQQMMALAVDLSEQRLRDGTASSAEIVYWLKQASPAAQLERKNLELQSKLLEAKIDSINTERESNINYAAALKAMTSYQPSRDDEIIEGEFYE